MQDIAHIIDGLEGNITIIAAFVAAIPEEKLDIRRRPGFWTIAEHVSHLAQVQPMLLERMQRFQKEARPRFVPYIPGEDEDEATSDTPDRMKMTDALAQFSQYRKQQLELFKGADQEVWEKMADHPEYERYGFHILARHILMHDHWHMYRMEELWLTRDDYLTELT